MVKRALIMLGLALGLAGCGGGADQLNRRGVCDNYPEYSTSAYVLPWAVGEAYEVTQNSCGGFSHTGDYRFAYDFAMEIGTPIHAARSGVVVEVKEDVADGDGPDNHIYIDHADGTRATYLHLTQNGSVVEEGEPVTQGDLIGYAGNTGRSTGPHLHFAVYESGAEFAPSVAVSFRNTEAQVMGLEQGKTYTARSFTPDAH